tara:strand:- start:209 stop:607 length:399 start_codon:yes stop_codon:yes gene_type:complete
MLFGLLVILSIGCSDGDEGKVFLRIRAILEEPPQSVTINNPDIPTDFQYDVYYETQPGSYDFSYVDYYDEYHPNEGELGILDIVADPGSNSSLFKQGQNGEDSYIDLILLSDGPRVETFDYYTVPSNLNYAD